MQYKTFLYGHTALFMYIYQNKLQKDVYITYEFIFHLQTAPWHLKVSLEQTMECSTAIGCLYHLIQKT